MTPHVADINRFSFDAVHRVLGSVFEHDLHAKRVECLCNATLGVLHSASLAVSAIGHGLAAARGLATKHATKQVDRLLSNDGIKIDEILALWVPYVIGARTSIVVAMDWTDFDADDQATIMLSLVTDHGRATPLVWLTVAKSTLKDRRNLYEDRVLVRLAEILPANVKVCILADRGFGDQKLYRLLTEQLHFDYVIRFRGNITVTAASGETRTAAAWVHPDGRARTLRGAKVTAEKYEVGTVVCVQENDMKQAWCLAASSPNATAKELIRYYGARWGIECGFRDTKNWLRVFEGRRIWLEAASVLGFRRSAESCAQKNCPIRANPNYDEIALPVPTFGHSGLPAIGLTPNSARQQKSEDWGGLQPNSPAFKNPQPVHGADRAVID